MHVRAFKVHLFMTLALEEREGGGGGEGERERERGGGEGGVRTIRAVDLVTKRCTTSLRRQASAGRCA